MHQHLWGSVGHLLSLFLVLVCSLLSFFFFCVFWQEFQEQMKGASFKDVVIRGKELSGALITALINVYIKDNASVDAISNHLRDICPLLYSSDDSVCSKVHRYTNKGCFKNIFA